MLSFFMINAFSNDKEIQRNRELLKAFLQMLQESIDIVKSSLSLRPHTHPDLNNFVLAHSMPDAVIAESFCSTTLPVQISIVDYFSSVTVGKVRNAGRDRYFLALLRLTKNFPHTLIYRETLSEKIAEVFVNSELDFKEHKKFSRKFYTLCKDKEKLVDLLYNKPMNELVKYSNLELEICGDLCLFRHSRKPVSKEEAIAICHLVKDVHRILH
jgi:hypothetical protein